MRRNARTISMTLQSQMYDVCVVGSGAAGAIAAWRFARAGLSVVIIEQGLAVTENTDFDDVLGSSERAMARLDNGVWAPIGYPWSSCNVGGGVAFYGAAAFRLRRVDHSPRVHLPGCELSCDWPLSADDLRPHYDAVEKWLGLAGPACGMDPTHPGGSEPPLPAVVPSHQARALFVGAEAVGLRPFSTPLLIATRPYRGRPACTYCSPCIEHRCKIGAKADAFRILVGPYLSGDTVVLRDGVKAVRLVRSAGRAIGYLEAIEVATGARQTYHARKFVLAANAIQTAALLLRSADNAEPSGLGNGNSLVGRGLCMKASGYVCGYPTQPFPPTTKDDPWNNGVGPFSTIASTDYYLDSRCPTGAGGLIYETRHGWRYGGDPANDVARLECLVADTPSLQNRVRLSSEKDRLGLPFVMIDYRTHPRDFARLSWLQDRAREWLSASGFNMLWQESGGFQLGSSHLHGTCRAGDDEKTSVVASSGRIHTLENVFVADGAYMPYPGGVNPTLTIQAISSHVSAHVLQSLDCDQPLESLH